MRALSKQFLRAAPSSSSGSSSSATQGFVARATVSSLSRSFPGNGVDNLRHVRLFEHRFMSSGNDGNDDEGKKGAPPENFYDEELEEKQELMDMATALADGGLHKLSGANAGKNAMTQEDWVTAQEEAPDLQGAIKDGEENEQVPWMDLEDPKNRYAIGHVRRHGTDAELAKHLKSYSPKLDVVPPEQLNYNVAWRKDNVPEENELNDFLPATSTDRFRFDKQGLRHCKGKNQRMGKSGELRCHLIDLDDLSHMDLVTMRRFLSEDAEILGRKHTGLCAKCQRAVAKTVKRARNLGTVPHLGEHMLLDSDPTTRGSRWKYHQAVSTDPDAQSDKSGATPGLKNVRVWVGGSKTVL